APALPPCTREDPLPPRPSRRRRARRRWRTCTTSARPALPLRSGSRWARSGCRLSSAAGARCGWPASRGTCGFRPGSPRETAAGKRRCTHGCGPPAPAAGPSTTPPAKTFCQLIRGRSSFLPPSAPPISLRPLPFCYDSAASVVNSITSYMCTARLPAAPPLTVFSDEACLERRHVGSHLLHGVGDVERPQKRVHHLRIELGTRILQKLFHRLFLRQRLAIGAAGRHRVVRVGHGDDAGLQGQLAAPHAVGIAAPVDALVVVAQRRQQGPQDA